MPKAKTFRIKQKLDGRFRTVGKATTGRGLKTAVTRARNAAPNAELRVVAPDGRKTTLGAGETMRKLEHIPAPGLSSGLAGTALCRIYAHYTTGDHRQIAAQAMAAVNANEAEHWCPTCLKRMVGYTLAAW